MKDFLFILLALMTFVILVITIVEYVLLIMRNKKADLIYRLIPIGGLGIKKALSDSLIPFMFMLTFIISEKSGIVTYTGILFFIILAISSFVGALVSIDLRTRGIFTTLRFIPWEDIVSINFVKRMYKDKVVSQTYVIELQKRRLFKKLTINTDMYHNPDGIIGEMLAERGFLINVITKTP